jgi:outer membrane protein assembly factor BamE
MLESFRLRLSSRSPGRPKSDCTPPGSLEKPGVRAIILLPLVLLIGSLTACSSSPASKSWLDTVSPYRFDRVQGNVITREQVAVLKTGMPRNTVKDILGTPLLASLFHDDRWDYVFTFRRQGAESQSRHVTVFFKGNNLDRYEADDLPTEAEFVATLKSMPKIEKLPAMSASEESLQKFPAAAAPAPVAPAATPALSTYPPLEPIAK